MESYYYTCRLSSMKQVRGMDQTVHGYPGFLGEFCTVEEAYQQNRKMLEERRTACAGKMDTEFPWLERETLVLERLCQSCAGRIALEVYECGQIIKNADRNSVQVDEQETG